MDENKEKPVPPLSQVIKEGEDPKPVEMSDEEKAKYQNKLMSRLREILSRQRKKVKLPKFVLDKQEKKRKSKRRESNKNRKINQSKARYNKFTK